MSAIPISVHRALPTDRLRDAGILLVLVGWLVYTRIYWILQASHVSAPVCPLYFVTGHPCPFCGGTRSFAYMWEGDLPNAVRLYPFGPVLFAGTITGAVALAGGLVSGRTWTPRLTVTQWHRVWIGAVIAVFISWMLKVFVLGN